MKENLTVQKIGKVLKKRFKLIIVLFFIGTLVSMGTTFFLIKPQYLASAQIIVRASSSDENSDNLQAVVNGNVLLINTYADMITGKMVLEEVEKKLNKKYDLAVTDLAEMITVIRSTDSQMFEIQVSSNNPGKSATIANTTATVFQKKATDVLDVKQVTITSQAEADKLPVSPNNKINILIGALLSFMLGIGLAIFLEFFDKTIKDKQTISDEFNLPVVGTISEMTSTQIKKNHEIGLGIILANRQNIDSQGLSETKQQSQKGSREE